MGQHAARKELLTLPLYAVAQDSSLLQNVPESFYRAWDWALSVAFNYFRANPKWHLPLFAQALSMTEEAQVWCAEKGELSNGAGKNSGDKLLDSVPCHQCTINCVDFR